MTALPTERRDLVSLRWGLLALGLATLVHRLPRLGIALPGGPGDFATGLFFGVAIGFLLLSLLVRRRA